MTGHWVTQRLDAGRLCSVMLSDSAEESHYVTGRWQGPVKHNRTSPVEEKRFWNLTGNDQTLEAQCPVSLCVVSGQ